MKKVDYEILKPAVLYAETIVNKFNEKIYSDEMFYYTGNPYNGTPMTTNDISLIDERETWAVVDKNDNVIGYISYRINPIHNSVNNFGLMSFDDKPNVLIGVALDMIFDKLINEYHVTQISWRMVGGNHAEKSYDNFCKKYNGSKFIFRNEIKDKRGVMHDDILYSIIFGYEGDIQVPRTTLEELAALIKHNDNKEALQIIQKLLK